MKSNLLFMALTAITLTLASCSKDDNDNNNSNPTPEQPTTIAAPQFKDDAVKLTLPANTFTIDGKKISVQALELTESGIFIVTYTKVANSRVAVTRDNDIDTDHKIGRFTKSGNSYNLAGYATVTINGKSGTTYNIAVKTTDGASTELSATATAPRTSDTMTDNLCRTWNIENTRVTIEVDGVTAGRDFPGTCDLNAIIAYAKERGLTITDRVEDNSIVTGITFTRAGTFLISYRNDDNDLGKWNWASQASGTINYGWDDDDMGNSLENGAAAVNFDGSKCRLTLNAALGTYKVQIIYTLIP